MKKYFFLFFFLPVLSFSQVYKITYKNFSNGKYQENEDISIYYYNNLAYLSSQNSKIKLFSDFNKKKNVKIMEYEAELVKNSIDFSQLIKPENTSNSDIKILGYKCKYAVFTSFSNKIEIWYTTDANVFGSPYPAYIPEENSLVLKIMINGNRELIASEIKKDKNTQLPEYKYDSSQEISASEFEQLLILSRYKTINVFENEQINYNPEIKKVSMENHKLDSVYHLSNGGILLKKIKIDKSYKGSYCYAELNVKSNGDAYDRTGSVFLLPDNEDYKPMLLALFGNMEFMPIFQDKYGENYQGMIANENFLPQIELMRFFTSFGVGHFNNLRPINNYPWAEKITYKQEISQLIPDDDYVWVGVFIGNYDKGGHIVSLNLNFYPNFEENLETENNFVLPIFNTVNILEMSGQNYSKFFKSDTLYSEFVIPENIEQTALLYTSTGHGGWGEGDEFVPKQNKIIIDDIEIYNFIPWRFDCATYRTWNPASGNFENGLSSSDLSRSNWCPGTLTNPEYIVLENLKPGKHKISVVINQGDDEGSSFSHWSVSGCIVGKIKNDKK